MHSLASTAATAFIPSGTSVTNANSANRGHSHTPLSQNPSSTLAGRFGIPANNRAITRQAGPIMANSNIRQTACSSYQTRLVPTTGHQSRLSAFKLSALASGSQEPTPNLNEQLQKPAEQFYAESGVYSAAEGVPKHLELFIEQSNGAMTKVREQVSSGEMSLEQGVDFQKLLVQVGKRVLNHPIVANNKYLDRFSQGGVTKAQARHEVQQFSVFAFQFNAAQAQLTANAETEDEWLERTKILANEMGAPYDHGFEGELKGTWNINHNHHVWLMDMAKDLGLEFKDIGKMSVANEGTKAFVDAIFKYYTNDNASISSGATFGVENWAANNLWKPWIEGMNKYNTDQPKGDKVRLGYIKYHDKEERHHSQATITELLANFKEDWFNQDQFLDTAEKMLTEGIQAYYESQIDTLPERDASWPQKAC